MTKPALALFASLFVLASQALGADKPNLVWIMADDLGYGDLGCYGQKVIQTPRLDRMAKEGMRFTQFYAGATVCAPSRSVLMTGQHHGHTRVRGNAGQSNPAAQALKPGDVTVAGVLQKAGYCTALVGKWGLGDVGAAQSGLPRKHGFDNGPHNESKHDLGRFNPSGPLTGIKRSLTDGGIRVPLIAWWPGKVAPGIESAHIGYFGDWMATAAELAGARTPANVDSLSFAPTLLGEKRAQRQHEFLYWEFHEGGFKQAALYQGRWKGIRSGGPDAPVVLYDLAEDIAEKTDVAKQHPDIAGRISAYLQTACTELPEWAPKWRSDPRKPVGKNK